MRYVRHGLCKKCGVYLLTCKVNGKKYVGSSVDMGRRITQHFGKTCLEKYSEINPLYKDIKKYGRDQFEFQSLEFCSPSEKYEVERKWYNKLKPEYNMVEPDECPFRHAEVMKKALDACATPQGIKNRLTAHRTQESRDKCREVQRRRMIPCRAILGSNRYEFESLCDAARWLNRQSKLPSVVSHIRYAIANHTKAFGYKWEVIEK